jgi:hypothetical protein
MRNKGNEMMMQRKLAWAVLAGALLVTPMMGHAAAKVVIVKSAGPSAKSYPPGKALPDTASIALRAGDLVTLLGTSASRTLRGPGTFTASAAGSSSSMGVGRRSRFGAMRSGEISAKPSLWDVDVTRKGRTCIAEAAKLKLWRPNAEADATLNVRGGSTTQSINFPAGHATVPWPSQLPVADGGEYQLEWDGSGEPSKVSFVMVKAPTDDLVDAAQVLIDKGCQAQLDLLVETSEKAD